MAALYLNLDLYEEDADGALSWRPTFLACLEQAMKETPKPGYPPCCLRRVALALLSMDDPLTRATEYVMQARPGTEDAAAIGSMAQAVLRYGRMENPSWEAAVEGG